MSSGICAPKEYQNIPSLFGTIISNRLATLSELRTIYSLEDALNIYEALAIPKYNEWREMEAAKRRVHK